MLELSTKDNNAKLLSVPKLLYKELSETFDFNPNNIISDDWHDLNSLHPAVGFSAMIHIRDYGANNEFLLYFKPPADLSLSEPVELLKIGTYFVSPGSTRLELRPFISVGLEHSSFGFIARVLERAAMLAQDPASIDQPFWNITR